MGARTVTLCATALIAYALKRFYADAPVNALQWMLGPTSLAVTAMTGVGFEWSPGEGYLSRERLFVIEKACAGINFLIAAFGLVAYSLRGRMTSWLASIDVLVLSAVTAYGAAVLVNAARIAAALWLADRPVPGMSAADLHRLEGIAVYFGGLLVLNRLLRWLDGRPASMWPPVVAYYAITLAVPLANGAAGQGAPFLRHSLIVLTVPLMVLALAAGLVAAAQQKNHEQH